MYAEVPADVDVLHLLALATPKKVDDVEILKVASNVVCEIDAMAWVAAGCSPMSRVSCKRLYSTETQAVDIPVLSIFVDWSVKLKRSLGELGQTPKLLTVGHHQGPRSTRLGREVTVDWIAIAIVVIEAVNTTCCLTGNIILNAGLWAKRVEFHSL